MKKAKAVLALANSEAAEKIKYALARSGFSVEDVCSSGSEALRSVRTVMPDILLINFDMPDMTGLEIATIVGDENLCSVLLFVTGVQKSFCADVIEEYDITLFPKPVNVESLLSAAETILQNRRRIEKLESELERLRQELDDRKAIDKAKGILMDKKSISEAEAYRRIQKMSMDSRVAMRSIAQKVIELSEKC